MVRVSLTPGLDLVKVVCVGAIALALLFVAHDGAVLVGALHAVSVLVVGGAFWGGVALVASLGVGLMLHVVLLVGRRAVASVVTVVR